MNKDFGQALFYAKNFASSLFSKERKLTIAKSHQIDIWANIFFRNSKIKYDPALHLQISELLGLISNRLSTLALYFSMKQQDRMSLVNCIFSLIEISDKRKLSAEAGFIGEHLK